MKYYNSTSEFNCGIDLHARAMYVCLMDRQGKKLVHTNIRNNDFAYFLKLIKPYRHDLTDLNGISRQRPSHNLGMIWSIRPKGTSAKNWTPARPQSRLSFEWIAIGLTESVSGPPRNVRFGGWKVR